MPEDFLASLANFMSVNVPQKCSTWPQFKITIKILRNLKFCADFQILKSLTVNSNLVQIKQFWRAF
jgi:hypothetical protein